MPDDEHRTALVRPAGRAYQVGNPGIRREFANRFERFVRDNVQTQLLLITVCVQLENALQRTIDKTMVFKRV